jgi:hypothetical protein
MGILMNYINSVVLGVSFTTALYSMSLFIATITCIVTLGLSMGALFPNKDSDDPEVITTSMSGLFFTAIALIIGSLSTYTLYLATLKNNPVILLILASTLALISPLILVGTTRIYKPQE